MFFHFLNFCMFFLRILSLFLSFSVFEELEIHGRINEVNFCKTCLHTDKNMNNVPFFEANIFTQINSNSQLMRSSQGCLMG